MRRIVLIAGVAILFSAGALAQTIVLPPGELAVFKGGTSNNIYNISTSRVQPCYIQVFDVTTNNQSEPIVSIALPTNQPNGIWINDHAGSEGGGISRSMDRHILALQGYTGNILSPTAAKPSADPTVFRGLGTLDAFGNEQVLYEDLANWFGLPPGVTQNNPTGIATADGTNFWGTGNVTGSSSEAAGTLFFNGDVSSTPLELQNYIQAAAEARIIGGTLYVVVPGAGIYNFLDPLNNDAVVPLPFDPNVANPVQHLVLTNLFLNTGSTYKNIANFDMNSSATLAYGADQTYGVVKFLNVGGVWQQAPYYFSTTNIGTLIQPKAQQGCFGICVDFSGTNPIIYATTMEYGTNFVGGDNQGNSNMNRLIRIVDSGNPGTNLVAQTLATATTTNETFRGIDFTPDLRPAIDSEPANYSTTNGGAAFFSVVADALYPLSYQWQQNGTNLNGQTSATLTLSSLDTTFDGDTYQCIVTDQYGAVTSAPPALLTVTLTAQAPVITSTVINATNFVGATESFAPVSATGTEPFNYQWYFGTTPLVDDGVKYYGSATASLAVSNLAPTDSGQYYLVVANTAGTASNLVDNLTVKYHAATILGGEPASVTTFVGLTTSLTATESGGNPPFTNQWYYGATAGTVTHALTDANEYSGSASDTLTISPASSADAGFYKLVIGNPAGFITSQVAQVTVLLPPPHSAVAYSNQVYSQNFNSLPDPGSNSVNSFNNPMDVGSLDGVAYSLANPFDFAYPVIMSSFVGGLGLSNTLSGWYGAADTLYLGVDGITRFGAQDGDQTTGGVIDFGPNDNPGTGLVGTNRSLGLLSTATTGATSYALKLTNSTATTYNYISFNYIGELWHNGTGHRTMQVGYTIDPSATNFVLTSESISNAATTQVPGLFFSFPTAPVVTTVDGTNPTNQVVLATNNLALTSPWQPGQALWLIWAIDFYGSGSGNGYAIDNLNFYASVNPVVQGTSPFLTNVGYSGTQGLSFSFTNTPSARFSVYAATNLTTANWVFLGTPTETPAGLYSTYQFTDPQATSKAVRFYKVTSP